jgi:hypothetical protein
VKEKAKVAKSKRMYLDMPLCLTKQFRGMMFEPTQHAFILHPLAVAPHTKTTPIIVRRFAFFVWL